MKKALVILIACLFLAAPAIADEATKLTIDPVIGASFGLVETDGFASKRLSYWAGASVLQVTPDISVWAAMQRTLINEADKDGVGPKFLLVIGNDEYKRWSLLAGGGWLTNFNEGFGGDDDENALTLDLGLLYEFLGDQFYLGCLGSAINTRTYSTPEDVELSAGSRPMESDTKLDWSIDFGLVGRF